MGPWTYLDGEAPELLRNVTDQLQRVIIVKTQCMRRSMRRLRRGERGSGSTSRQAAEPIVRRGLKSPGGWTWASDQYLTLPQLFRLDESQVQVCIRRLEMPVSLGLGDQGFFKDPLFLPERIQLCRDIGVETLKGGHHLLLEGA